MENRSKKVVGLLRDVRIGHIHLSWQRLFEVGFDVRVDLA